MLNNFKSKDIGVITIKKIIAIAIGLMNFPKKIPNLNHIKFNGVKILELSKPKIKKIIASLVNKSQA